MMTGFFLMWVGIFLVIAWNPLILTPMTWSAALIFGVGLTAVLGGSLWAARWIRSRSATYRAIGIVEPPRVLRWTVGLAVASAGLAIALLTFRDSIVAASGSASFGQLTAEQVRYYQVYGATLHAGIGTTLFALAPLIAAGGVVLGHQRRLGYVFTAYAIFMSLQTPSRTEVFFTVMASLLCWLYYKPVRTSERGTDQHLWRRIAVISFAIICLIGYFQYEGDLLHKSSPAQLLAGTKVPQALFSPVIYLTGEPEALSAAITENVNPTDGEHGRTIWIVPRVLSLLDRQISAPSIVAQPVAIPYPYNTYSWTGDLWLDFGWPGVVLGGLFIGFGTVLIDERAYRQRSALWSWWGAAWGTIVFSSFIGFEFFWLNSLIFTVAGLLVFGRPKFVSRSSATPVETRPLSL